jgi:hypothetical protein
MSRISVVAIACLVAAPTAVPAAAPSAPLYGKSVVISWSETRQQRDVGQLNFRSVAAQQNLSIYVSSAGRVFSRFVLQTGRGTGASEQVAGGDNAGSRVPSFQGRSMILFAPFRSGGMRRVVVDFDAGFGSCNARVGYARESGHATSIGYSRITQKLIEVQAIEVGGASCSVQNGNVFGGQ